MMTTACVQAAARARRLADCLQELASEPDTGAFIWRGEVREGLIAALCERVSSVEAGAQLCDRVDAEFSCCALERIAHECGARTRARARAAAAELNLDAVREAADDISVNPSVLDDEAYYALLCAMVYAAVQTFIAHAEDDMKEAVEKFERLLHCQRYRRVPEPENASKLRWQSHQLINDCARVQREHGHQAMVIKAGQLLPFSCSQVVEKLRSTASRIRNANRTYNTRPNNPTGKMNIGRKRTRLGVVKPRHQLRPVNDDSTSNRSEAEDSVGGVASGSGDGATETANGEAMESTLTNSCGIAVGTSPNPSGHALQQLPAAAVSATVPTPASAAAVGSAAPRRRAKRHACERCDKRFVTRSHLTRHVQAVHEGRRPYECMVCNRRYTQKEHLKDHIKSVHEKVKPYKCSWPDCHQSFARKEAVVTHVQTVHEKLKPHKCNICDKHFGQRSAVLSHMRSVHKIGKGSGARADPGITQAQEQAQSQAQGQTLSQPQSLSLSPTLSPASVRTSLTPMQTQNATTLQPAPTTSGLCPNTTPAACKPMFVGADSGELVESTK